MKPQTFYNQTLADRRAHSIAIDRIFRDAQSKTDKEHAAEMYRHDISAIIHAMEREQADRDRAEHAAAERAEVEKALLNMELTAVSSTASADRDRAIAEYNSLFAMQQLNAAERAAAITDYLETAADRSAAAADRAAKMHTIAPTYDFRNAEILTAERSAANAAAEIETDRRRRAALSEYAAARKELKNAKTRRRAAMKNAEIWTAAAAAAKTETERRRAVSKISHYNNKLTRERAAVDRADRAERAAADRAAAAVTEHMKYYYSAENRLYYTALWLTRSALTFQRDRTARSDRKYAYYTALIICCNYLYAAADVTNYVDLCFNVDLIEHINNTIVTLCANLGATYDLDLLVKIRREVINNNFAVVKNINNSDIDEIRAAEIETETATAPTAKITPTAAAERDRAAEKLTALLSDCNIRSKYIERAAAVLIDSLSYRAAAAVTGTSIGAVQYAVKKVKGALIDNAATADLLLNYYLNNYTLTALEDIHRAAERAAALEELNPTERAAALEEYNRDRADRAAADPRRYNIVLFADIDYINSKLARRIIPTAAAAAAERDRAAAVETVPKK